MQTHSRTFRITRAGRRYMALLAALNTGDADTITDFTVRNLDPMTFTDEEAEAFINWCLETHHYTGGMDIHRVYLAEDYYVIVIVQARRDGSLYLDKLKIDSEDPFLIIEYAHDAAPAV